MKLTISKRYSLEPQYNLGPVAIEYDGKPECRYIRTDEVAPADVTEHRRYGCHVVWCYYKGGKRVATVTVTKLAHESTLKETNSLERCWPERFETVFVADETDTVADDGTILGRASDEESKAWMRNADGMRKDPVALSCLSDAVFMHPDDDAAFDSCEFLTCDDRKWITENDAEKLNAKTAAEVQAETERKRQVEDAQLRIAANIGKTGKPGERRGPKPATPEQRKADAAKVREWQMYCKKEAAENENLKPDRNLWAKSKCMTLNQFRAIQDRVKARENRDKGTHINHRTLVQDSTLT